MFNILLCITMEHDWRLVILAALVCVTASLATFDLYAKAPPLPVWARWSWLGMTGLVAGSGVWTTHFVAMIAFRTGLPTGYAPLQTMGSLAVAIVSITLGFGLASSTLLGRRNPAILAGGLVIGLGITAMHYVGMAGYRTTGILYWNTGYVVLSVLIGTLATVAALIRFQTGSRLKRVVGAAGLFSLAIVGMHFSGMTAVTIVPDVAIAEPASLMSSTMMIAISVAVTAVILLTALGGVAFDTASRNGNLKRLREALDVMPEGLAFYDAADRLVAWNQQYADLCAQHGAELVEGMPFAELLRSDLVHGAYPEARGRESEWLAERQATRWGAGTIPSLTQQTSTGRWLRVTDRRTADGGTVSVSIDITDLKRAEEAMAQARDKAEEQARRAELAESLAHLGHWRLDLDTRQITWSAQMYEIYGIAPDAVLEVGFLMALTHPEDAETSRARFERQSRGAAPETSISRIIRADGQIRLLSGNYCAERDGEGRIIAIVGTIVDVTEQKQLEDELRRAQAEAEAATVVKSEFLANMSHELRTPLTSIVGFTSLAVEQPDLSPLTRTYVERVADASRALLCTVNDILDFSKLESGQVSIHPQPVDLAKLTQGALDMFLPQAGAKDLTLILDADGEDCVVDIDPDRIRQILLNLVGNAVKFTAQGCVTLRTRYDVAAQRLDVEVVDTGTGIPPSKIASLFQRFSQVDGSLTRAQGGTGLGLAICKGLVEAMGGRIGVDSQAGYGSRFWFNIPASPAVLSTGAVAGSLAFQPLSFDGVRVLVVDDHQGNRELARLFLLGSGAEVSEAGDGEEAIRMAMELPYDAILMDLQMPLLDGRAALHHIRHSDGPNEDTPILAFTAGADLETKAQLIATGFQDIVAKPLEPLALIGAVARATTFFQHSTQQDLHHVG